MNKHDTFLPAGLAPESRKNDDASVAPREQTEQGIEGMFHHRLGRFTLKVSFEIAGSGITVLFGPSGSGKSTFLRCLAGLERPASAYLKVRNELWHDTASSFVKPTYRRSIGMVFQEPSLFDHMTVRQNLSYGSLAAAPLISRVLASAASGLRGCLQGGETESEELRNVAALLGIEHLLNRCADTLSGGEKQRVAIARAILRRPEMLLLDEPLSSLDLRRKQEILPFIERLHRALTVPIIYVTHSVEEAIRLGDRILMLEDGRIVTQGDPADMLRHIAPVYDDVYSEFDAALLQVEPDGLARLCVAGADFYVYSSVKWPGKSLRCRISAGDVSLALSRSEDTSILNVMRCRVSEIRRSSVPAHVIVCVLLADESTTLFARITERSLRRLNIVPGMSLWAQIKAVAIQA